MMRNKFTKIIIISLVLLIANRLYGYAHNNTISPELNVLHNKQQHKAKDKENTILITPHYKGYQERNNNATEKVVAIYDKRSPAYGYRYILYKPIGKYVGHHKVVQPSLNGYGYDPIPEGGEGSSIPCFKTIQEAKHFYYPQWY